MSKPLKTLEPGVYENIPAEDYHAAEGVSNTVLGQVEKSPGTVLAYRANPPESTEAQKLGTMLHTFCLEPDMMMPIVCQPEGLDRRKTKDREWLAEHEDAGIKVLKKDQWDFLHYARENMFAHPFIKRLLSVKGRRELSVFHRDDEGLLRKCRADLLPEAGNVLADLKSTTATSAAEFGKAVYEWGYHRAAAWYLDTCNGQGLNRSLFGFIVACKVAPYPVDWYPLSDRAIQFGRQRYRRALAAYRHFLTENRWDHPPALDIPEWAEHQEKRAEEVTI